MEETVRQTELPRQRHSDHSDRLTKTHRGVPSGDAQMLLKEQRSKNSEIKFAEKNSRREKRITDTKNIAKRSPNINSGSFLSGRWDYRGFLFHILLHVLSGIFHLLCGEHILLLKPKENNKRHF